MAEHFVKMATRRPEQDGRFTEPREGRKVAASTRLQQTTGDVTTSKTLQW